MFPLKKRSKKEKNPNSKLNRIDAGYTKIHAFIQKGIDLNQPKKDTLTFLEKSMDFLRAKNKTELEILPTKWFFKNGDAGFKHGKPVPYVRNSVQHSRNK